MNSNDAALTSACDSVQELRLARAGEAKADRMKTAKEREQVIKRKSRLWRSNACKGWTSCLSGKKSIKTERPNSKEILWECDKLVFWGVTYSEVR